MKHKLSWHLENLSNTLNSLLILGLCAAAVALMIYGLLAMPWWAAIIVVLLLLNL